MTDYIIQAQRAMNEHHEEEMRRAVELAKLQADHAIFVQGVRMIFGEFAASMLYLTFKPSSPQSPGSS